MKQIIKVILAFLLAAQTTFAGDPKAQQKIFESKPIYTANPTIQSVLIDYWNAFNVAKIADGNVGRVMAADIRLAEIVEQLEGLGLSEQAIDELREQAQEAFVEKNQKQEVKFTAESFNYILDQLEKLTPETTEHFSRVLEAYVEETPSRKVGWTTFKKVHAEQEQIVVSNARFAFYKLAISFYLLAESQNFIGSDRDTSTELNRFSSYSLAAFLQANDQQKVGASERQNFILGPILKVYSASGVPELAETSNNLINYFKTYSTEPKARGFFKNLGLAFKNRNKNFHVLSLFAPMITTGVAIMLTATLVSGPEGWGALRGGNLVVLIIWGMAFHFFSKDVFGMDLKRNLRDYTAQDKGFKRVRANKALVIKSLEQTCDFKLSPKSF